MKKLLFLILAITAVAIGTTQAQTDDKSFSFQGYAVDDEGKALGSTSINVKFSLYPEGESVEYTETHTLTTDAYGVFTAEIGSITPVDFEELDFNSNNYFLTVEVKKTSEGVYTTINDAELMAVPYARSAANGVPVGAILPFGGTLDKVPEGWLPCDGSSVLIADYPQLYDMIGTAWGHSGSYFNLPDLRGLFLRGVDHGRGQDPDRGSRSTMHSGGNSGDNVGSYQSYTYQSHYHTASASQGSHSHGFHDTYFAENDSEFEPEDDQPSRTGNNDQWGSGGGYDKDNTHWYKSSTTFSEDAPTITVTVDHNGGSETRPRNANVEFIIKY